MALVPTKTNDYTLGRGALYFAPFKSGTQTPDGRRFFGDVNQFDITFKSTDLDHYSSVSGTKEMDQSIVLQVDRTGQAVTENIDSDNLAIFFLGSASKLTQTATTVTAEHLDAVNIDRFYQVGVTTQNPAGNRSLDPATPIVVTDDAGTPVTFVVNTDYVFDYDIGQLYIVPGGGVVDGANLRLTYKTLAATIDQVVSGGSAVEGELYFVSHNAAGTNKDALIPWVRLSPNGNFSLIGDKLTALTFDIKALKKSGLEALYINGRGVVG